MALSLRLGSQVARPPEPSRSPSPLPVLGPLVELCVARVGFDVAAQSVRNVCRFVLENFCSGPGTNGRRHVDDVARDAAARASHRSIPATAPAPPSREAARQLPVVRRDTIGQKIDWVAAKPSAKSPLESRVVLRLVKQPHPAVVTIQNVVGQSRFDRAGSSGHVGDHIYPNRSKQQSVMSPLPAFSCPQLSVSVCFMYQNELILRNEASTTITVFAEPWAEELDLAPNASIIVRFESQTVGLPEVSYLPRGIVVYGYPGSMCYIIDAANGTVLWEAHQHLPM